MEITYVQGGIHPEEVIKFLALTGQSRPIFDGIIRNKEVLKKTRELGLIVSDEQLQEFADRYRMTRGFYAACEMVAFLKGAGLTYEDFEVFCEAAVLTTTLKNYLSTNRKMEDYFVDHRSEFDLARISMLLVKEKSLSDEIVIQVTEEGEDFHKLARQYSIDAATRYAGGYVGCVSRGMLPLEVAAKVFNANAGDLLGPFKREDLFQLISIEEVIKAELNEDVKEVIKERIFGEWASQFLRDGITING